MVNANARQVIRRTKQISRWRFSPEEKVRIVIEGIRGKITVTSLCGRKALLATSTTNGSMISWKLGKAGSKETQSGRPVGPRSDPCSGRTND